MSHPENIDILDENGNPTGAVMTLTDANLKGEWHAGVHLALYTRDRRVLLQQRSKAIMFYPGQWELGVGGAVSAGENLYNAARREVEEELGVTALDLQAVTRWKYNHHLPDHNLHVKVFLYAYIAEIDPAHLHVQQSDAGTIRLLPMSDAHDVLFRHKGLPHVRMAPYEGYYRQMLAAIEAHFHHPHYLQSTDTMEVA